MNTSTIRRTAVAATWASTAALLRRLDHEPGQGCGCIPTVTASLDSTTYRAGDKPVLTLTENVTGKRSFAVTDSSGAVLDTDVEHQHRRHLHARPQPVKTAT